MNPYQNLSEEITDPLAEVTKPIPGVSAAGPSDQSAGQSADQSAGQSASQPVSQFGQPAPGHGSVAMSGGPYEPYEPPKGQGPSKLVIGIAITGLALAGLGVAKNMFFPAKEKLKPRPQATGYFAEQQKMMREAIDMAKEAQHMQKMHMEEMRRTMEEGYSEDEYTRGGDDGW